MMFGPLIRRWCMRFEGKHLYFKNGARAIKILSLAQQHQCMETATSIQINDETPVLNALSFDEMLFGKSRKLVGHKRKN